MSHNATIYVYYHHAHGDFSVSEMIRMYLENGWNLNDFGHISLRPLGDKDNFDWIQLHLDQEEELFDIIKKKVEANEDPALVLMWNDEEVGAVTTFFPQEHRISFLLMIGRKIHPELPEWTDFNWYLSPILKPLTENGFAISQVDFSDWV